MTEIIYMYIFEDRSVGWSTEPPTTAECDAIQIGLMSCIKIEPDKQIPMRAIVKQERIEWRELRECRMRWDPDIGEYHDAPY